ncbi:MAG: hypothetical protein A2X77_00995 [Gammaproteobacteria bacterium GWE2_42_36]|nr:MAG: hypothetical protein A2X77_00995 [Gammaproteobacteria bacterium GWE2_42_36]HCU05065.1 YihA family ribosome biogenesis GTP-binding protein [Coxiellaceae bacterium]
MNDAADQPQLNFQEASFLLSAAKLPQLPKDEGFEVAFIGRSNAGKSSALNELTHQKQLARVSKTPGRTQLINVFCIDDEHRLIDLPGYGYAKVPTEIKREWHPLINQYLRDRHSLHGLILLMDIRHPMKAMDEQMLDWSAAIPLPVHILLTKCDKLTRNHGMKALHYVQKALKAYPDYFTVQLFSAMNHIGVDELKRTIHHWKHFAYDKKDNDTQ